MRFRYDLRRQSLVNVAEAFRMIEKHLRENRGFRWAKEFQVSITSIISHSSNFSICPDKCFSLEDLETPPDLSIAGNWESSWLCWSIRISRYPRFGRYLYSTASCLYTSLTYTRHRSIRYARPGFVSRHGRTEESWREREREREKGERKRIARQSPLLGKTFL